METKLNGNGCGQAADELTGHQRHGKRHGRTDVRKCGRVHERQHGPDDKRESGCGHAAGHGQKNAPGDGNAHGHQGGHACNGGPGRDRSRNTAAALCTEAGACGPSRKRRSTQ